MKIELFRLNYIIFLMIGIILGGCTKPKKICTKPKKIMLISIDTLRADHLSVYGYARKTPNIDALALDSVIYERAYTNGCWTMPSHMSMLTGTLSARHGVNMSWFHREGKDNYRALSEEIKTIAEVLPIKSVGFAKLPKALGFNRGFSQSERSDPFQSHDEYKQLLGLIDKYSQSDFFFFVHTWMVHTPYSDGLYFTDDPVIRDYIYNLRDTSDEASIELQNYLKEHNLYTAENCIDLYDGGINRVDCGIGRLMEYLKKKNLYEEMLIIVTSDHGENFGDHYKGFYGDHGKDYYEEYVRVPLIIKFPYSAPKGWVKGPVSLIDLFPTILDFCSVDIPDQVQGQILPKPGEEFIRTIISEATTKLKDLERKMLLRGDIKLIVNIPNPSGPGRVGKVKDYRVYNLKTDPRETKNISGHQHLVQELEQRIKDSLISGTKQTKLTKLTEETKKQLRALGYFGQ